jgi:hypothetical protein
MKKNITEFKMPLTPITKETFERQGWKYIENEDSSMGFSNSEFQEFTNDYYYKLNLPKFRDDAFAPAMVSNTLSERYMLKEMGIPVNQFIVSIENLDGLGMCKYEEEVEILYRYLTGYDIDDETMNNINDDQSNIIFKIPM